MHRSSWRHFLFCCLAVLCVALSCPAPSFARGPDWCPRRSKTNPPNRVERARSAWCQEHPGQCEERAEADPKCQTQQERYMDQKGNRDGYVSQWERDQFGGPYRPWN